jgi:hypothetical protein
VLPLSLFSVVVTQPAIYKRAEFLFILFFILQRRSRVSVSIARFSDSILTEADSLNPIAQRKLSQSDVNPFEIVPNKQNTLVGVRVTYN